MARQNAFTLLELLIVLAILGGLLGLVTPNLSFDGEGAKLEREASSLRQALQSQIDQAWLQGESRFVELDAGAVSWFILKNGEWEQEQGLYLSDQIRSRLLLDESQLDSAVGVLDGPDSVDLVILSNGEYLPFQWTLISEQGDQRTITGDGINALALQ